MSDQLKLSYAAGSFRVRCEISRAAAKAAESPPADLIARAKTKLESVKNAGEIAFFYVYETRLNETWKALREAEGEADDRKVVVTVGAGAPLLNGIKAEKSPTEKAIALLHVEPPKDAATWRYEWFKLMVVKRLRDAGVRETPNFAQVFAAFLRAQRGEKVTAMPITSATAAMPAAAAGQPARAFSVVANKQRLEIGVVIRNMKELLQKSQRDAMLILINQAVRQLATDGVEYKILKKDFLAALQAATDGPESLNLELPVTLLAAVGTPAASAGVGAAQAAAGGGKINCGPSTHPGAAKISFAVSSDKMEATITGFAKAYYDDPTFQVDMDWLLAEIRRCGLRSELTEDMNKAFNEAMRKKDDLNGLLAARGVPGAGGRAPYLHQTYKDAAGRSAADLDTANIDMREMQQRATVKSGQLVAQVRYKEPPVTGRNVYNEEIPAPPDDQMIVRVGDGIVQRDSQKYYATADGIPMIDEESISLSKVLVHNGDVNLRSGNIRFDGPVEIKGSIDMGAVVDVTGDLIVHGTIRAAQVRAGGNIEAKSGIVTGGKGRVQARGHITAEFIENSNVVCGGDIYVAKAIINSRIISGGTVKISAKDGVIAGGIISARDAIITRNLGFKRGALTTLNIGVDWKIEQAMQIRKGRLERCTKRAGEDRQALRELVQKKAAQMTARHKEMKDELQDRLGRFRTLIENAEKHLQNAIAKQNFNASAKIIIHETLAANCAVSIGGQVIPVPHDVANVAIVPKRRRGSYIVPLEEYVAEEDGAAAGAGKGGKKAS